MPITFAVGLTTCGYKVLHRAPREPYSVDVAVVNNTPSNMLGAISETVMIINVADMKLDLIFEHPPIPEQTYHPMNQAQFILDNMCVKSVLDFSS